MSEYQVLARRYRPQKFCEVLGQDAVVSTLKNAIRSSRLAHAYLFCGSRGTGKTTLARVLAKALNCQHPQENFEPCNTCSSCKEITSGHSMDVLEIDGASHRGIDDIRQINETVGYASSSGKYKIYIIDEVHMLTKEAFNALLKTLEEPPENVKFLFATTEPHKVLPTILSRCQRFNLNRIPLDAITDKLRSISKDMNITVEEEALHLLAKRADGGLRDAESLLDQIFAFHEGNIQAETVASVLGMITKDVLFELDTAGKEGRLAYAFEAAHNVFSQGKDFVHFVECLVEHFRNLLLIKMSGKDAPFLLLSDTERDAYEKSATLYSKEQCLNLLDFLVEEQSKIRFAPSPRMALEAILLHIMRSHQRLPIEFLVRKLTELEERLGTTSETPQKIAQPTTQVKEVPSTAQEDVQPTAQVKEVPSTAQEDVQPTAQVKEVPSTTQEDVQPTTQVKEVPSTAQEVAQPTTQVKEVPSTTQEDVQPTTQVKEVSSTTQEVVQPTSQAEEETQIPASPKIEEEHLTTNAATKKPANVKAPSPQVIIEKKTIKESVSVDPTPTPEELGVKVTTPKVKKPSKPKAAKIPLDKQSRYDTLLQFAAIELEGRVQKEQ